MQFWQQLLSGFLLISVFTNTQAATITVSQWNYTLADNIVNAGDYYAPTLDSPANASRIAIDLGGIATYWKVQAKRESSSGINISVMRTGNGSGDGSIADSNLGSGLILLNQSFKTLFCGYGSNTRTDIPLQFHLSNLDVDDGYSTSGTPLNIPITYQIITNTTSLDCT